MCSLESERLKIFMPAMYQECRVKVLLLVYTRGGIHRVNIGESLETLSAVKSQSWVSF
jgi:hypothetical protein